MCMDGEMETDPEHRVFVPRVLSPHTLHGSSTIGQIFLGALR